MNRTEQLVTKTGGIATMIADDAVCLQILTDAGIPLSALTPRPPFNHASHVFQHRGGWCLATHDTGHESPRDNGYSVLILDGVERSDALEFFAGFLAETTHGRIEFERHDAPLEFQN